MKRKLIGLVITGIITSSISAEYLMKQKIQKGISDLFVVEETYLYDFSSHTFNSCGIANGHIGPTLSECRATYNTNWDEDNSKFNMSSQGIQEWTVPDDGSYRLTVKGAGSGSGKGAVVVSDFSFNKGDVIKILVGQKQKSYLQGSGGSFVATSDNTPLIVAGGGGGVHDSGYGSAYHASLSTSGINGLAGNNRPYTSGGSNGLAGSTSSSGGTAGSGFYTSSGSGKSNNPSTSFINGGLGASTGGGFGGGGGYGNSTGSAGGGGGYSGGGTGGVAGGGGSFSSGSNQSFTLGVANQNGSVRIEKL